MKRQLLRVLGAFCAVAFATGCHGNDNNMITAPAPTTTPMPGVPTPTPAPGGQTATVQVGQGGGNAFMDQQSGSTTTTIHPGDSVQWVWVSGFHSTTSGTCAGGCQPNGQWDSGAGSGMTFSHTFSQAGSFPYFCTVHGAMMTGTVIVQ